MIIRKKVSDLHMVEGCRSLFHRWSSCGTYFVS